MADTNLVELFTDIADAIRTQEESEEDISALDFPQRILDLEGGLSIFSDYDLFIEENVYTSTVTSTTFKKTINHFMGARPRYGIVLYTFPYTESANNIGCVFSYNSKWSAGANFKLDVYDRVYSVNITYSEDNNAVTIASSKNGPIRVGTTETVILLFDK